MAYPTSYSPVFDSAATANSIVTRDGSGDTAARRLALAASSGGLDNLGYERGGVYSVAATFTIDNGATVNGVMHLVTTGSSNRTANLPAAASWTGLVLEIVKVDSGTGTVIADGNSTETINSATTYTLYEQWESVRIRSDGSNWEIVGRFNPNEPLQQTITDPGNAGAIPVARSGTVALVSAGAETRTLAAPSFVGQMISLNMKTDNGDITLTCATFLNTTGNNTAVFNDAGDVLLLLAVNSGSNKRWRVVANDTVALSTV